VTVARADAKTGARTEAKTYARIRRTKGAKLKEALAVHDMRKLFSEFDRLKLIGEELGRTKLQPTEGATLLTEAMKRYGTDPSKSKRAFTVASEILDLSLGRGQGLQEWRGTAWALTQAVSEYTNHLSTVRKAEGDEDLRRLDSNMFGRGSDLQASMCAVMDEFLADRTANPHTAPQSVSLAAAGM